MNYLLGGKDNCADGRQAGDPILKMFPAIAHNARVERRFLARAVRYLAGEAGVRQFLDIGTGLPTPNSTHQIAQQAGLLTSALGGMTSYVEADVRDPERILGEAATLDLSQPVGLMMLGILGARSTISTSPSSIVTRLLAALPSGSHLALFNGTDTNPEMNQAIAVHNQDSASSYHLRSFAQIAAFFQRPRPGAARRGRYLSLAPRRERRRGGAPRRGQLSLHRPQASRPQAVRRAPVTLTS